MNALRIEVDGNELVAVNLDGMHLLSVSVHSSLDRAETALLEVHGGTYGGEVSGHRTWVAEHVLAPEQSVKVSFTDCAGPFDPGQTMAEMFPDDDLSEEFDFTMTDARAAELRARPQMKHSFSMTAGTSSGAHCSVDSDPQNDHVTFMVLWDHTRPSQARVSVHTYCSEDIIARRNGGDHLRDILALGGFATCMVA